MYVLRFVCFEKGLVAPVDVRVGLLGFKALYCSHVAGLVSSSCLVTTPKSGKRERKRTVCNM